jgi:DNA repair protein RecN (Recombination protein N)
MLAALSIQNVVLIERLNVDFAPGFCALTGETGAGKSILLDSLGLALGGRADSGLLRKGTDQASVSAVFEISAKHPVHGFLREQGIESDQTLVLRRILLADGRSRAFINDQPVSIGLLKSVGEMLVEIHGQFETQGLLNPGQHRAMLDDYAGLEGALLNLWQNWRAAEQRVSDLKSDLENAAAEESYLRMALEDLDGLSPRAGEEAELAAARERLMHRGKILEALQAAHDILTGDNDPVGKALNILSRVAAKMPEEGQAVLAPLDRAAHEIAEGAAAIAGHLQDMEHEELNLEALDDRLHDLRAQARKHQCAVDDLPGVRESLAQRLNAIDQADTLLVEAMRARDAAQKTYTDAAKKLSEQRKTAAQKLDRLVAKELTPLKLDKARFVTDISALPEAEWGEGGMDRVRFLVATNPGAEPGPINKIASGGELARFMLALKVVMAEVGDAGTLIFDEVDTGIGGSTADAVGERLERLSKKRQILVVTHSPQVAARAARHFIVRKDGVKNLTTNIQVLMNAQERREEIARMLAGAKITEEARAAAGRLLETGT